MRGSIRDILSRLPGGTYTIHGLSLTSHDTDPLDQCNVLIHVTTPIEANLKLRFRGVRNLQLRTGPYSRIQVAGILIDDISNDQISGVRYRVSSEDDDAMIEFACASIEVDDSVPSDPPELP